VALTDAMVCRLRWPAVDADATQVAHVERRLLQRASSLLRQRARAARATEPTAALLAFLQDFARRSGVHEARVAEDQRKLRLPMGRLEIGQYLGYAEETICRSFHRLQEQGLATVADGRVRAAVARRCRQLNISRCTRSTSRTLSSGVCCNTP
jgi:CRP-like cAMP-binding protein